MNRTTYGRLWILAGIVALLVSGGLAMVVTAGKNPLFEAWATRHIDLVRWCLVEHVNLANLIWFTALPAGLIQFAMSRAQPEVSRVGLGALPLAICGIAAMLACHPGLGATPVLSNYIPVLDHRLYLGGLATYLASVTWVHLAHVSSFGSPASEAGGSDDRARLIDVARFGLWLGSVFFLAAMSALFFSWRGMALQADLAPDMYYDVLFWGGGHLMQHASACFLLAAWIMLMSWSSPSPAFTRTDVFPVFAWMGLPLLALPWLLVQRPATDLYRDVFTEMMRWGIAPPMAFFLGIAFKKRAAWWPHAPGFRRAALVFSILLIAVGVAFGVCIRGQNLRIPGHYHATIGAITIAFMTVAYLALGGEHAGARHRLVSAAIPLYGVGQLLFSSGLFVAGAFGLGRKTYGTELGVTQAGQAAALIGLSLGGMLALAGGICFAVAWIRLLGRDYSVPHEDRTRPRVHPSASTPIEGSATRLAGR